MLIGWQQLCVRSVLVLLALVAGMQQARAAITIEQIARIKYPASPAWSPDGRHVAFLWDAWGRQDLHVVRPGRPARQLTDFAVDPETRLSDINRLAWTSPREIIFSRNGRLWRVGLNADGPRPIPGLEGIAGFTLSASRRELAVVEDGQLRFVSLASGNDRPLTFLRDGLRATDPVLSADDQWVAFLAVRQSLVPHPLPFNGRQVLSHVRSVEERRLGVVSTHGSDVFWVPTLGDVRDVQFAGSGALVYQEIAPDWNSRSIKIVPVGGSPRTLWTDRDERWWSPHRRDSGISVSPDGKRVVFSSDREGWVQLYVIPTDAESADQATRLTTGEYLSSPGSWSPDSSRFAYHHGAAGRAMERFISIVDIDSGSSRQVVTRPGVNIDPVFSPDGDRLVFSRSDPRNPLDLYVASAGEESSPVRLGDSLPGDMDRDDLTVPEYVEFPSRVDGSPVPATLIVHEGLDRSERHPAIVWIHGSGADQNYLGWHPGSYRMYYSLHQYLAQQGYVILTPDYRGSSGYSRAWATAPHGSIGVTDVADVASGADYLKTLEYVDPDRIGVWGLSYGGFMTVQALWRDPGLWRAGIDVAGVTGWAERREGIIRNSFTIPRLGSAVINPRTYELAAPYRHVAAIERPLLIMHGTDDRNVAFHNSLLLMDRLLKAGKDFETVIYPGEQHFFRRDFILRDAWRRVEAFFDRHLRE